MTKKKSYADMDPLEEIRAIREEICREFKTMSAFGEYLRKKYPRASGPGPELPGAQGQQEGGRAEESRQAPCPCLKGGAVMKKKSYADMDPLEEIRAIKEEISREFKTVAAYDEYLQKKYPSASGPVPEFPAADANKKKAGRKKASKRLAHA